MSFRDMSTQDLVRIADAGGGFRLEAAGRPTNDLVKIAVAASSWGVGLVFAGMVDRSTDDLVRIAAAGEGSVQFED